MKPARACRTCGKDIDQSHHRAVMCRACSAAQRKARRRVNPKGRRTPWATIRKRIRQHLEQSNERWREAHPAVAAELDEERERWKHENLYS